MKSTGKHRICVRSQRGTWARLKPLGWERPRCFSACESKCKQNYSHSRCNKEPRGSHCFMITILMFLKTDQVSMFSKNIFVSLRCWCPRYMQREAVCVVAKNIGARGVFGSLCHHQLARSPWKSYCCQCP